MNTGQLRQSKRIMGIEASPLSDKVSQTGARPKVLLQGEVETQASREIGHSNPHRGSESLNPIESTDPKTNPTCNYRNLLLQQKARDSGLGEESVVEPANPWEETVVGAEPTIEEGKTKDRESSDSQGWRSPLDPSRESSIVVSADENESEKGSPISPRTASPAAMAQ
ncbi:hypothetical protein OUZ56_033594 [Daphnia magna]|uniref:Uncharacterized protein n=1 Tax=Daphnia magna TaxID=35525 RepID=A0ABQ9ZY15_9CRUS|nr:hypothetical protein OUZ56_033594 [Daphnia magna]